MTTSAVDVVGIAMRVVPDTRIADGWREAPMRRAIAPSTTRPCTMRSSPMRTTTASAVAMDTSASPAVRPKPSSSTSSSLSPAAPRSGWLAQRQGEQPGNGQHGRRGQTCPRHRLSSDQQPHQADRPGDDERTGAAHGCVQRQAGRALGQKHAERRGQPEQHQRSDQPAARRRPADQELDDLLRFERPTRASPRAAPPSTRSRACRCDRHPWGSLAATRATLAARRASVQRRVMQV